MLLYGFGLYLRAISKYNTPGILTIRRTIKRGFYPLRVWGAYIWRGLYMDRPIFGLLRPVLSLEIPLKNIHLPMPSLFQLSSRVVFDMWWLTLCFVFCRWPLNFERNWKLQFWMNRLLCNFYIDYLCKGVIASLSTKGNLNAAGSCSYKHCKISSAPSLQAKWIGVPPFILCKTEYQIIKAEKQNT